MPYIIPNVTAIPQTVSAAQIIVNGTTCTWPSDKIVEGVKVIHQIECSIGTENTGEVPAELKFTFQRDIGSGWENVAGEVACYTIASGDDARRKANFKVPYYTGISGFAPRYRLLAECPVGEVTLHRTEGRDTVPTVTGKQEHGFEGELPVLSSYLFQPLSKVFIPRIFGDTLGYRDIEYGSGYFVAIAHTTSGGNYYSKAFRSPDTINWSEISVPADRALSRIVHGDGVFIISSALQNLIWRSVDAGLSWTEITLPKPEWFPIKASLNKVAFGLSMFVGVCSNESVPDQLFKSTNLGMTWETVNVSPSNRWHTIAFGNDVFVALGYDFLTGKTLVYDGSSVTLHSNISTNYNDMAFGDSMFVAVRDGNEFIRSSNNGTTWTAFTVPLSRQWNHIIYDNELFVVTASDGLQDCMMTSPDATVWTVIDRPAMINSYLSSVAGNNAGLMVAVSGSAGDYLPRAFITFDQDSIPVMNGQANVSVGLGEIVYHKVSVPASATQITITLESITTDLGLYVGIGYLPNTYGMNDYYSAEGAATEQVIIPNTEDTLYAIGILGHEAGSGVLKIALS
jgi:hypothetical protein